ncbi:LysR family transcriptional regulator [uncultured Tateyamaria sp.]|nr:LysR family transcriptional regulator [uncultured Tateyamaria sp.]
MKKVDVLALDGRLLKTFLAVYETKSVTRASEMLGVSQSSVSHSLNRLRDCLDDPLFRKLGRGITPTNAAALIAPKAAQIVSDMEGLELHSEYVPAVDDGFFTIATNVTELLPALSALKKRVEDSSSNAKLKFVELGDRRRALEVLDKDLADLAVTASVGTYPLELSVTRLYQDPIVCFYDGRCRQAPSSSIDYCASRHAVLDFGGENKSIVDRALEGSGLSRKIHFAASNSYALARLAIGTDVIATLPRGIASDAFRGFEYCSAPFPLPPVTYDMVWHRRYEGSARHIWFRQTFSEAVTMSPHL